MQVSTIGLDLAKSVFQVHAVDPCGKAVLVRKLRRKQMLEFFGKMPPCLVGMEACATAHHWARELTKLGHTVRLIPPSYVKAYVKRSKNDAADAAAICEAVTWPSMRIVPVKTVVQQGTLSVHRTRDLLIGQRTQLINALRAHLAELGIVAQEGRDGLARLIAMRSRRRARCNRFRTRCCRRFGRSSPCSTSLQQQIGNLDRCIQSQHRAERDEPAAR